MSEIVKLTVPSSAHPGKTHTVQRAKGSTLWTCDCLWFANHAECPHSRAAEAAFEMGKVAEADARVKIAQGEGEAPHTIEPWEHGGIGQITHRSDDRSLVRFIGLMGRPKDAVRLIACVNACQGVPNDVLKEYRHFVLQLMAYVAALEPDITMAQIRTVSNRLKRSFSATADVANKIAGQANAAKVLEALEKMDSNQTGTSETGS